MLIKGIPIFFGGTISNSVSPFPEDRKLTIFSSSKEDFMISHDLCNLVFNRSEEECDITVALIKI